ncbi:MAG: BrxA/BrxB family bacilliredoxin, partial [Crocinitomicaceae bacterium]|nr:BrxA/BrxB family bacilliredoxin [Crocinitomicaceae bacterium]
MYPPELVKPMKEDLTTVGFNELLDADAVDQAIQNNNGTLLVVVN